MYPHTLVAYSSTIYTRNLHFYISVQQQCSYLCLCAVITQHTCFEHNLHLHMQYHAPWVSPTSDMNITCYLHSITMSIVYVHSGQEKCLLPHSIIPMNAVLSLFWSHFHILMHTVGETSVIYYSPKVFRPRCTFGDDTMMYMPSQIISLHVFYWV